MTRTRTLTTTYAVLCAAALLVASAGTAQADFFVVQPEGVTASSAPNSSRLPIKTIDGSGLSDTGAVETGQAVPDDWPTHDRGNSNGWFSDDDVAVSNHWITFDLGAAYDVQSMHIWNWNYNGGGTQTDDGIKDVVVKFSLDGSDFASIPSETFTFSQAPNDASYGGEAHELSGTVTARYVRFDIQSTFEHASGETGKAAFAEARFVAIPEPATMALVTLGGIGLLLKRRRSRS